MNIQQARQHGISMLSSSPTPQLDTDCLLMAVLQKDKTFITFHREENLTAEQEERLEAFLKARSTGLPVAYITGKKEFFGYDFIVTPDVLIPKYDTELLVEQAIETIEEKRESQSILTICDMCTGSGCVGISILKACIENKILPEEKLPAITFVDISTRALDIARKNADQLLGHHYSQCTFTNSNLFEAVRSTFDIIVTNPPYIPHSEVSQLLLDGRNEPPLALNGDINLFGEPTGDDDGLGIMRNLVPQAVKSLSPGGVLIAEAGEYNAEMTEYLFRKAGLQDTKIIRDLNGDLRDIRGTKK